jgi:anaerobic selenocysteine-containing dehydrogenase
MAPWCLGGALFIHWRIADAILLREKYDSGEMTQREYQDSIGAFVPGPVPNIKMVFFRGDSGCQSNTDVSLNKRLKAYAKLDFFVGIISSRWHESHQAADIVLPQVPTGYGLGKAIEVPTFSTFRNVMSYQPRLVPLPGEVKEDTWVNLQLAKRLGFGDKYSSKLVNVSDDQWDAAMTQLHKEAYEAWTQSDYVKQNLGRTPPTWEEFLKKPWIEFPLPTTNRVEHIPFEEQIQGGQPFATESGKIELYSKFLANPSEETWNASNYANGIVPYGWYLNGPIAPMGMWEPYWTTTWTQEEMNKFPIFLDTHHSIHRIYEYSDMNPLVGDCSNVERDSLHSGDVYENTTLKMSVADAKARGIQDGDRVRIFNEHGQVVVKAVVTSLMAPGYASLTMGRFAVHNSSTNVDVYGNPVDVRGNVNSLTYDRKDPSCVFPHDAPVQVEKF